MKGIIFNLVEDAVVAEHGDDAWDALLQSAGVDGAFTAIGNYPDEQLTALVEAGAAMLGVPADDLTRHLGHAATLGLAARYPQFFAPHEHARDLLLTLNDVIHTEVRKLHTDAAPPDFWFDGGPDSLNVHYRSERRLCMLAEGMVLGTGTHYGETLHIDQTQCTRDGHDHCSFHVTFARD